jgi:hypothetical protein
VERNTLKEYEAKAEAKVIISEKKQALKEANVISDRLVYLTDRSSLDDIRVRCPVAWREQEDEEWNSERYHLGKEKQVFDAECYAILEELKLVAVRSDYEKVTKVMIFSDSTTVIKRVRHTRPIPGESVAIQNVECNNTLFAKRFKVVYGWVPSHEGVEGHEKADEKAKAGNLGEEEGVEAIAEKHKGISLAKIHRKITEAKWSETEQWWKAKLSKQAVERMNKKK